jgi:anthranilate phosphoribosyltransferase
MTLQQALEQWVEGRDISREAMRAVMTTVMTGEASQAQIGALLVALRMKGEAVDEIAGAAEVMRELVTPVSVSGDHVIDLVGTGGDGANLFNVSTAATFVAAAAGAQVAKHGNRSVSSSSGSSDVLETLGVNLDVSPEQIAACVQEVGLGFMFAPAHHGAMKHAVGPRRELGLRTFFNVLGPLTNPAGVKRQVLGVYDAALCEPLAEALARLGSEHALVLHSDDGLDEISIAAPTQGFELKAGDLSPIEIDPATLGHAHDTLDGLQVETAADSARLIRAALDGDDGVASIKARSIIALNAGAGIYVSGVAESLASGIAAADQAIASGAAMQKLEAFVAFTQALSEEQAGAPAS